MRVLRSMVAAAVALPVAALAGGAWLAREATSDAAQRELERTADAVAQYSLRVLETHRLAAARVNDLLRGLSDEQILAREAELHAELRRWVAETPLIQTLVVLDREGRHLVTANVFPVRRDQDYNDREWMQELRRPDAPPLQVSRVYVGRADGFLFFGVSRRRTDGGNGVPPGVFDGVINVSVEPNAVAAGFAALGSAAGDQVALVRSDGQVLARVPAFARPPAPVTSDGFRRMAAELPDRAVFRAISASDGKERVVAVRRVGDLPVYGGIAREAAAVTAEWRRQVALLAAFVLPAGALLVVFAVIALRRARRAMGVQAQLVDEAGRRAAAEAAQAAGARFRAVFESGAIGIAVIDTTTGVTLDVNGRLLDIVGDRDRAGGWNAVSLLCAGDEIAPGSTDERVFERDHVRPDGAVVALRIALSPLRTEPGRIVMIVGDVTAQRRSTAQRELLMREIEHRSRNTLSIVQTTLRLGLGAREETRALADALEARIGALARTQSLLSRGSWTGADLGALVAGELAALDEISAPGAGASTRFSCRGPALTVAAAATQPLTMALHELATNAAKYGAWTSPAGRIEVDWAVDPASGALTITWGERGGPPPEARARSGFGTRLIDATIGAQLGGVVERSWEAEGLVCRLVLPAQTLLRASDQAA